MKQKKDISRRKALAGIASLAILPGGIYKKPFLKPAVKACNKRKRFALGVIFHESNTFCPEKTGLEHFREGSLCSGNEIINQFRDSRTFPGGVIDAGEKTGVELVPTFCAYSYIPYGIVDKETFNYITGELYNRIKNFNNPDGVILCLHGGMVAENSPDPEGEILENVRKIVGDETPISCTLDMHCNVSQRMVNNTDAFFFNNENPHLDSFERGVEAVYALNKIVNGELNPVMSLKEPGMLPPTLHVNPPTSGPLVGIFKRINELEKNPKVININIGAGFPWSDIPDAGMSVVSVVDNDRNLADKIAEELSQRLWDVRQEFIPSLMSVEEAVERAMNAKEGPVMLVDVADNPGDGTTEDSTGILRCLIEKGAKNAALAVIRDPDAVEKCVGRGINNEITLDLGCKYRVVDEPVGVTGIVKKITGGGRGYPGLSVVLDIDGIEVIVTERTMYPNHPNIFRRNGIDPVKNPRGVKSVFMNHFAKGLLKIIFKKADLKNSRLSAPRLT